MGGCFVLKSFKEYLTSERLSNQGFQIPATEARGDLTGILHKHLNRGPTSQKKGIAKHFLGKDVKKRSGAAGATWSVTTRSFCTHNVILQLNSAYPFNPTSL
jgi:hypothetical protein